MKILFLNPHLHEAPVLATLRQLGVAAIVCSDLRECELVFRLHGTSVTLFVGHDADGVKMNEVVKTHKRFSKTPVILTTSHWTETQCIQHQSTPMGANAYLRLPVDDRDFIHVIDEILGSELSHGRGFQPSNDLSVLLEVPTSEERTKVTLLAPEPSPLIEAFPVLDAVPVLEDAGSIYGLSSVEPPPEGDNGGFIFDAPHFDLENVVGNEQISTENLESPEIAVEGTQELKIDGAENIGTSDIFASPIMAAEDEQLTRIAMPIQMDSSISDHSEAATQVQMSMPIQSSPLAAAPLGEDLDPDALSAMPYLSRGDQYSNPLAYREPMDDAVVPGGAMNAPDTETLKKYLYLREQDVTALSAQLRQAREQIGSLEAHLRHEKAISSEFAYLAQEQDRRIDGFDKEKQIALESAQKEVEDLKFEMKRRSEKIRVMELHVKEATDATERLKERVRIDIRKIRSREKELENRLEIMKKDSEALLGAREQKIIELKRKLDLLEFNMDLFQDQLEKEKRTTAALREKLAKAAQIVRVAGGLLSPEEEAMLVQGVPSDKERTPAA